MVRLLEYIWSVLFPPLFITMYNSSLTLRDSPMPDLHLQRTTIWKCVKKTTQLLTEYTLTGIINFFFYRKQWRTHELDMLSVCAKSLWGVSATGGGGRGSFLQHKNNSVYRTTSSRPCSLWWGGSLNSKPPSPMSSLLTTMLGTSCQHKT